LDFDQSVDLGAVTPFASNTATWIDLRRNGKLRRRLTRDLKIDNRAAKVNAFFINRLELDENATNEKKAAHFRNEDGLAVHVVYDGRAQQWIYREGKWNKLTDLRFKVKPKAGVRDILKALASFERPKHSIYYEGYRMVDTSKWSGTTLPADPRGRIDGLPVYQCGGGPCGLLNAATRERMATEKAAKLENAFGEGFEPVKSASDCLVSTPDGRVVARANEIKCRPQIALSSMGIWSSGSGSSSKDTEDCAIVGGFAAAIEGNLSVDCGDGDVFPLNENASGPEDSDETSDAETPAPPDEGSSEPPPAPKTRYYGHGHPNYPSGLLCNNHCSAAACRECCTVVWVGATAVIEANAAVCYAATWWWPPALLICGLAQWSAHLFADAESAMCMNQCGIPHLEPNSNNPHRCSLTH
jgi:hypothetical protein